MDSETTRKYNEALERFNMALLGMAYKAIQEAHPDEGVGGFFSPDGETVYAVTEKGDKIEVVIFAVLNQGLDAE